MKKQKPSPSEVNSLILALIRKIARENLILKSANEAESILKDAAEKFNPKMPENFINAAVKYAMLKSLPEN